MQNTCPPLGNAPPLSACSAPPQDGMIYAPPPTHGFNPQQSYSPPQPYTPPQGYAPQGYVPPQQSQHQSGFVPAGGGFEFGVPLQQQVCAHTPVDIIARTPSLGRSALPQPSVDYGGGATGGEARSWLNNALRKSKLMSGACAQFAPTAAPAGFASMAPAYDASAPLGFAPVMPGYAPPLVQTAGAPPPPAYDYVTPTPAPPPWQPR